VFNKKRNIEQANSKENSIEGLIEARKWPVGGLQELSQCVMGKMGWARDVCTLSYQPCVSIYNHFMQLFMAAIFACKCLTQATISFIYLPAS